MRLLVVIGVLPFVGCVATSKFGMSSSSSDSGASEQVTIPNVFKKAE